MTVSTQRTTHRRNQSSQRACSPKCSPVRESTLCTKSLKPGLPLPPGAFLLSIVASGILPFPSPTSESPSCFTVTLPRTPSHEGHLLHSSVRCRCCPSARVQLSASTPTEDGVKLTPSQLPDTVGVGEDENVSQVPQSLDSENPRRRLS